MRNKYGMSPIKVYSNKYLIFATILISYLHYVDALVESETDAKEYLQKYGYLYKPDTPFYGHSLRKHTKTMSTFTEGISMFQMYSGLQPSGILDAKTKTKMNELRCGMAERMEISENSNMNRTTVSHKLPKRKRKWKTSVLSYKVHNYPSSGVTDPTIVRQEIRRAFQLWEEFANLRCIEYEQMDEREPQLAITFLTKYHGDGSNFGNETDVGNVAAHAFYPDHVTFKGEVHFDDERLWTAHNTTGLNLFQVAVHEIGHALGLEHSMYPESVMHAILHAHIDDRFRLHEDDIQGIQNLYGRRRARGDRKSKSHKHKLKTQKEDEPQIVVNVIKASSSNGINLGEFWRCFEMNQRNQGSTQAKDCYVKNALRLLYSLKI